MPKEIEREMISLRATTVLQCIWKEAFHLEHPTLVSDRGRNEVLRSRIQGAATLPQSVIVKRIQNPLDPIRGLTEWASLAFLSQVIDEPPVAPHFFGGDREHLLFVMEDLGEEGNLEHLLLSPDSSRAISMFCALASQMGRLHATTMGKERQFERLCEDLSLTGIPSRWSEAERWLEACHHVEDWCHALSYQPPAGFEQGCRRIAETFAHPGAFLALTHGDPAPSNTQLRGSTCYLLDFEYAGYRHALYDLTGWNILCPLPKACVDLMSHHLRAALLPACPEAGDDERYQADWAMLCAYRALAMLSWMPRQLLTRDLTWANTGSRREAMVVALSRCEEATQGIPGLEVIAEVSAHVCRRCQALWPDVKAESSPAWPAFLPTSDRVSQPNSLPASNDQQGM